MPFLSGGTGPSAADSGAFSSASGFGGVSQGFNPLLSLFGLIPSLIGQKQLGGIAPPFQPGEGGGLDLGGIDLASLLNNLGQEDQGGVTNALEELPTAPQVTELPSVFNTDEQNSALTPETSPGFLSEFFGKMDSNLQSPSKVLGLGLLNRLDPKLGLLGLLSSGLFGGQQ